MLTDGKYQVALLAEGVDRNTLTALKPSTAILSPSLRRAWIEIKHGDDRRGPESVALLAEGVDSNILPSLDPAPVTAVALLAEGVDRNRENLCRIRKNAVALLAEGVDRKTNGASPVPLDESRPPCGGRG